jgi:fatty acid desaturase/membrane-associated phospholipid phosphatase
MKLAKEKAGLVVLIGIAVTLIYFGTLHATLFPATPMPTTALDSAIPFAPTFVISYFSFFVLILMPIFFIEDRRELHDAVFGFGIIVVVSGIAFLFWPTAVTANYSSPLLKGLLALDGPKNACPSMHGSLSIYCALCMQRHLRTAAARIGLWAWALLIMASALLIKRHVAIDMAAGAGLGWMVYLAFFRPIEKEAADSKPVVETLRIRKRLIEEAPGEVTKLTKPNLRERAREGAVFVGLALLGFLISAKAISVASSAMLAVGIAISAVALNTFPLLMHEGMHGTLLPNRRWNWIVSVWLGSVFLMSFTAYRVLHIRHHRYLGDPRDPDDYHNYSRSRLVVWSLHFVRLAVGPLLYLVMIPVLALKYGSQMQRRLICCEYAILLLIYSALLQAFTLRALLLVWIAPLLLVGLFTAIRGFTQHGITDATDPYLASRTMLPHPLIAFFLLNENYHLEHHLFPEVPSYHLHALHQLIWPKIPRAVSGKSYLAFLARFFRATPRMDETPIGLVHPGDQ